MVNGFMKLVSRSLLVPRKLQQRQPLFPHFGGHHYLQASELVSKSGINVSERVAVSTFDEARRASPDAFTTIKELLVPLKSGCGKQSAVYAYSTPKDAHGVNGIGALFRRQYGRGSMVNLSPLQVTRTCETNAGVPCFYRYISSKASEHRGQTPSETKKDISTVEDPFDAPTYNIPEKPVTFAEGASYSFIILAGLGVAAAAGYAVFKELIFQPKEYKIFDKALKRIQDESQVRVRIGSPITGYGQESRNRAARQRIPNRIWTDENGVERVEVNFYIRGPHGAGKVYTEMFKDQVDKQWKYTYLIVEVKSPSPAQLILESYIPA